MLDRSSSIAQITRQHAGCSHAGLNAPTRLFRIEMSRQNRVIT